MSNLKNISILFFILALFNIQSYLILIGVSAGCLIFDFVYALIKNRRLPVVTTTTLAEMARPKIKSEEFVERLKKDLKKSIKKKEEKMREGRSGIGLIDREDEEENLLSIKFVEDPIHNLILQKAKENGYIEVSHVPNALKV
jgi:hypothetical protein